MANAALESATQKLALYFYFSYLDDARAEEATLKGLRKLQKDFPSDKNQTPELIDKLTIQAAHGIFQKSPTESLISHPGVVRGRIEFPKGSDWGGWFAFRRLVEPNEFEAVLWTKILKIPEAIVADALNTTVGTIRLRTARGLKVLGKSLNQGAPRA